VNPTEESPKERTIRVLSASTDPNLNLARTLLLQHHGFKVTALQSKADAVKEIESRPFDVLIFGSTLPRDTCWELAGVFRKHNSAGRIVEIVPSPWAAPKNQPDATVVSSDEPSELIKVIREQLT
jgi:PleD family two-component response regulator